MLAWAHEPEVGFRTVFTSPRLDDEKQDRVIVPLTARQTCFWLRSLSFLLLSLAPCLACLAGLVLVWWPGAWGLAGFSFLLLGFFRSGGGLGAVFWRAVPLQRGRGPSRRPLVPGGMRFLFYFRFCIQVHWRVTSFPTQCETQCFPCVLQFWLDGETDGTEVLVGVKIRNPVVRNPRCDLSLINALECELQIRSKNDVSEERRGCEYEIPGGTTVLFVTGNS